MTSPTYHRDPARLVDNREASTSGRLVRCLLGTWTRPHPPLYVGGGAALRGGRRASGCRSAWPTTCPRGTPTIASCAPTPASRHLSSCRQTNAELRAISLL